MRFAYLKDPVFVACFCLYWINRILEYYELSTPLLRSYLNDVVCIPFWVPIMLWVQKRTGLRTHDHPPECFEIVIPLVLWAVLFEVVIPGHREWAVPAVADPCDVLCYSVGSLVAVVIWRWYYRPSCPGDWTGGNSIGKGLLRADACMQRNGPSSPRDGTPPTGASGSVAYGHRRLDSRV